MRWIESLASACFPFCSQLPLPAHSSSLLSPSFQFFFLALKLLPPLPPPNFCTPTLSSLAWSVYFLQKCLYPPLPEWTPEFTLLFLNELLHPNPYTRHHPPRPAFSSLPLSPSPRPRNILSPHLPFSQNHAPTQLPLPSPPPPPPHSLQHAHIPPPNTQLNFQSVHLTGKMKI